MAKSRKQCSVKENGRFRPVKAYDVGKEVYEKKTGELLGILLEPNPNTNMLRMQKLDGTVIRLC